MLALKSECTAKYQPTRGSSAFPWRMYPSEYTCTITDTNVMSASIATVSGSTMMPQPTSSGPALNQSLGKWCSPTPLSSMSNSTGQTATNAATMASTARCLP